MEELIKKIMAECEEDGEPVTEAEAREMAEMEIKAKGIKNYTATEKNRKPKAPRTKKVADEKKLLFQTILTNLQEVFGENVEVLNENKLIFVKVGNESFKVDIIQSRKPKK
jgi:hypothetical protein